MNLESSVPSPSVFGQSVTFTATVTSCAAPVTLGTVTFTVDGTVGTPIALNGAGTASFTTSTLSVNGGIAHNISAAYSGASGFNPQFTSGFEHTVNQASTTTVMTQGLNPTVAGQAATFTATVSAQAPGAGTPTGSVIFVVDGVPIAPTTLVGGVASISITSFAVGSHTVNASFSGDANFAASAQSNTVTHTVNQAFSTTALTGSSNPSEAGAPVTLTATVSPSSPGSGTPTGTVNFYEGVTLLGSSALISAQGSITISTLTPGVHVLTAVYSGDPQFVTSTSPTRVQNVNKAATTTTMSPTSAVVVGQNATVSATVTSAYPGTVGGTVTFYDGATSLGSAVVIGGTATSSFAFFTAGAHTITATFNGDPTYAASTSTGVSQTVNQASTITGLNSSPTTTVFGQSVTFTATVVITGPGFGTLTGNVQFKEGATVIGTGALNGSGVATLTTSALAVGSHSITATYLGDANFITSTSSSASQTVNQASTTTALIAAPTTSVFGQSVTFTATVAAVSPGSGSPTGSVQFKEGATILGTGVVNGSGVATLTTSALSVGSHSVTATYAGDASFATSTSSSASQTVNQASTATALVSSPNPAVFGQSVSFTATVSASSPGAGTPTGSVQFKEGATTLGTVALTAGTASFSTASLSIGSHSVTATYVGDANFVTSTSTSSNQVVNQAATTTALVSSLNPSTYGTSVTFTATVNVTSPGAGTPTGTVTFKDGATTLGTATLNASRIATLSTAALTGGAHSITATYNADANFSGSVSSALSQIVNKASTTTALTITGPTNSGATQVFTATVTSSAGVPTGTVTFLDGASPIGTGTLNSSGVATLSTSLAPGAHPIAATYNGDGNFSTSTSSSQSFSVSRPDTSTTLVLRSGTPNAGESLTFAATVSGQRGRITGVVTFRDNNVVIGTVAVDAAGTAVLTARLALGPHMIVATYEGDTLNNGSTAEPLFLTVKGAVTVTLTSSANPSAVGAAVTFTAAVASATSGGPAVTGTVSFTDGTRALGNATVTNGQASISATGLASGDHSIVASYSGDLTYLAANSATLTQKVDRAASTTALDAGADANGYFLVATVRGSASGPTPGGAVNFEDATTNATLGSGSLSDGTAMVRLAAPLPVGHRLRAVYAGDTTFAGSSSGMMPFIAGANAFSFSFSFAQDSIVSIFGSDLADSTVTAPSLPLPTTLGGVSVKLIDAAGNSHNAELYFVSAGQINIVVPGDVPAGNARLVVTTSRGSASFSVTIGKSAPSLASGDGSGAGPAAAHILRVHADGSQDPLVVVTSANVPFGSQSDSLYLILYGTGFRNAQGAASCTLNGQSVTALYSGPHATYPGLDQLNLQIPGSLRGAGRVTVSCTVGGQTSNTVTINVQ